MWTEEEVTNFLITHTIDTSWKDGWQLQKPVFSKLILVSNPSPSGTDAWYEMDLLNNLRHHPQHTLIDVLDFFRAAIALGHVTLWNHPDGCIKILFDVSYDPGP